ncbi:MAG: protein kinase [Haloarculaceae archaeon]
MASSDRDGGPDPATLVLETLTDPDRARERLPYVVGLFESDERFDRLCAAWICCLVIDDLDDDDTIEYLVRRLSDRLDGAFASLELTTALDYISTRRPDQVERILQDIAEDAEDREMPLPQIGNFTRNHYYSTDPEREGVGRTSVAGAGKTDDPRRTYADFEREGEGTNDESDEEDGLGGPMAEQRTEVSSIASRSRFDTLHILASRHRDRYADIYEALVGQSGEDRAVALRLLDRPDGNRLAFEKRVESELRRWEAVDDHPNLVSVFDWGGEPRPWLVTMFTGETLLETDRVPPRRAVMEAADLASAVAHLHQNGVIHGGIDPRNVSYPGDVMEGDEPVPVLDNVGLLSAFRFHFDPALCLDPRYAAPEYFDDSYGQVDHATDIYQLGAVLYHRLTGRSPFSGGFDDVRESVLSQDPVLPSQVAEDVPPEIDDVVTKAMAKGKLTRYETVEHFVRELVSVGEANG